MTRKNRNNRRADGFDSGKKSAKKKWIVGVCAVLVVAIGAGVTSVAMVRLVRQNQTNRMIISNIYQENLYQMSESVGNVEINMSKLMVSTSDIESAVLLNDTYRQCQAAIVALGYLPVDENDRREADRFLNQLGDWCDSQSKAILSSAIGDSSNKGSDTNIKFISEKDGKNQTKPANSLLFDALSFCPQCGKSCADLLSFCPRCGKGCADSNHADKYVGSVECSSAAHTHLFANYPRNEAAPVSAPDSANDLDKNLDNNKASSGKMDAGKSESKDKTGTKPAKTTVSDFDSQVELLFNRAKALNKRVTEAAEKTNGTRLVLPQFEGVTRQLVLGDTNNKNSTEVPELIYDGPFSDGASAKSYKCVEDEKEVTADEAAEKAKKSLEFINVDNINLVGETSNPDAYAFSGDTKGKDGQAGSPIYFLVSKKGGIVVSASTACDNTGKSETVSQTQAKQLAQKYAALCGYKDLQPVWYTSADGFAVVNLTPVENDVVIYPDLVKVKVCLVNGDFKGIEAAGYCTYHHARDLSAGITSKQAQAAVSPKLAVKNVRLALIPKDMGEKLCWEFAAEYKGLDYFVYIDAGSGKQCNILRVIDSEQGSLAI